MYYQTSLGTYDLIFGASMVNRKWLLAADTSKPSTPITTGFGGMNGKAMQTKVTFGNMPNPIT